MTTTTNGVGTIQTVSIPEPNIQYARFTLTGLAPYVQLRFTEKAKALIREKHKAGSQAKKGRAREARDFDSEFERAMYQSTEGWRGVPASSFRNGLISACRTVGFRMTLAKLSVFVQADGIDVIDRIPLVRIHGEPEAVEHAVRNATGVADLRVRAMWHDWTINLTIEYDGDQFSLADVTNLLSRMGRQVGIGEGRPDSKNSPGMGWGLFEVSGE